MKFRREGWISRRITAAGLPAPESVAIGVPSGSIAATFLIDDVPATIEGHGTSDQQATDEVIRQLRVLLERDNP